VNRALRLLAVAAVLPPIVLQADEPADGPAVNERYTLREDHDPNGIGKFYMGREIAHVMGFGGVDWLERPTRNTEEGLNKLVKALDLEPGMVVADIGAGSGVISLLMAKEVGPTGKVIAVDIQDEMLSRLEKKLEQLEVANVEPHRGGLESPKLKDASIDVAIMVDVYHEFAFPYEMTLAISKAVKPGGRVVLVEYRKEDPRVAIKLVHKMTEAQCKKELALPEFGLTWKETLDVLPQQHIVVFEKRVEAKPKSR
jgi:tRNA A58 N-methylase Trm61